MSASQRAITVDDITPAWLTETLRRHNVLPSGNVVAIEKQPNAAFNSHTLHLTARYEGSEAAPTRFLLKCSLPAAWAQRAGALEVAFYHLVTQRPDHPAVIVRCYDAAYDATTGNSHLLLQDLSESHRLPVTRDQQLTQTENLPTDSHLAQAIDALARFHAYWWQHPLLGTANAPVAWGHSSEESFVEEVARRTHAVEHLLAQEGTWLPSQIQTLLETLLANLTPIWQTHMRERVATSANLTLTHGDAYLANFLCPKEGQTGNTYIIDWQCPESYRGPTDLVNLCATFWTREQRAAGDRELNVLRQYHRTLQEQGVHGYAWDDLVTDYKLSILDWLFVPVQDALEGSGKSYWWPKMQCLVHAFEDWHCADLLTPTQLSQTHR